MAKKKTVVEEVKLQDAPILRDSPEPEAEAESDPAPERKPWVDFIPPYVKDNARGYPRYVDKLAEALNGVVEGGGGGEGGTGAFDFIVEIVDTVTINDVTGDLDHSYELVTTWEDVVAAGNANKNIYARIKQIQTFPEELGIDDVLNFQTEPVMCEYIAYSSTEIGIIFNIPFLGSVYFDPDDDPIPYEGYVHGNIFNGDFDNTEQFVIQYFEPRITQLSTSISLFNFGSRVQLNLQEAPIADVQSATIPLALRPSRNSGIVANFVRGSDGDAIWAVVNDLGAIALTTGSSVSTFVDGSITWFL